MSQSGGGTGVLAGPQPGPLATLAQFKGWLQLNNTSIPVTDHDDALNRLLRVGSEWIQIDRCYRWFSLYNQTIETYPNRVGTVDVVDLVTVDSILVDYRGDHLYAASNATLDADHWWLGPLLERGQPAVRFQEVHLNLYAPHTFPPGHRVKITGTFGYVDGNGDPPEAVVQALLIGAARIFKRRDMPLNLMSMPSIGFKRLYEADPEIEDLLRPFIHVSRRRLVLPQ